MIGARSRQSRLLGRVVATWKKKNECEEGRLFGSFTDQREEEITDHQGERGEGRAHDTGGELGAINRTSSRGQ